MRISFFCSSLHGRMGHFQMGCPGDLHGATFRSETKFLVKDLDIVLSMDDDRDI